MLKVDTVFLENQAGQMQNLAETLEQIAQSVASANQRLQWDVSISSRVRRQLGQYDNYTSQLSLRTRNLAAALSSAAAQYAATEQGLLGKETKVNSTGEAISLPHKDFADVWEKIADLYDGNPGCVLYDPTYKPSILEQLAKFFENYKGNTEDGKNLFDRIFSDSTGILGEIFDKLEATKLTFVNDLLEYGKSGWDYFSGLWDKENDAFDNYLNLLSFGKDSLSEWKNVFSFLEQHLDDQGWKQALLFSQKWGRTMSAVSMYANSIDFAKDILTAYETYRENKGDWQQRNFGADVIDAAGSGAGFGASIYGFANFTNKVLSRKGKGGEWILKEGSSVASNVTAFVKITDAYTTFASTALRSYEEYSADGTFDGLDLSAANIDASLAGLNKLFGGWFSDETVEAASDHIKNWAGDFGKEAGERVNDEQWLNDLYNSGHENAAVTIGIVEEGAERVADTAEKVVDTVQDTYNNAKNKVSSLIHGFGGGGGGAW